MRKQLVDYKHKTKNKITTTIIIIIITTHTKKGKDANSTQTHVEKYQNIKSKQNKDNNKIIKQLILNYINLKKVN